MSKIPIIPPEVQAGYEQMKISPGLISGEHVFFSGVTGSYADGSMPSDPEAQFRMAFQKIGYVLRDAGLKFGALVEMTSYHIGLRDHFELFNKVRLEHVSEPYPTWTAVEVAGLRREGAVVEIRVIASTVDKAK